MHCQKGDKNPLSQTKTYVATSSGKIFASYGSRVSNSSVNQPVNRGEQFAGLLRLARPETRTVAVSRSLQSPQCSQRINSMAAAISVSLATAYTTLEIRFAFGHPALAKVTLFRQQGD
jgi:hypothetical protein